MFIKKFVFQIKAKHKKSNPKWSPSWKIRLENVHRTESRF